MGRTSTSGMTVSSGCERTNRTVSATFAGSWSTAGSRSGNRSSRNGVRMPPATTAVTLMFVRPGLDVQGVAQAEQAPLARVVGRRIRPRPLRGRRDDVHDLPAPWPRIGSRASFDIRNGPRRLTARMRSQSATDNSSTGMVTVDAGVVDEDVEPPEPRARSARSPAAAPASSVTSSRSDSARPPRSRIARGDLLREVLADVPREDHDPGVGQGPADRLAEPAAAAQSPARLSRSDPPRCRPPKR